MIAKEIFVTIIALIHFWYVEPFIHEMGHALELKKIEGNAAISLYIPFASKFHVVIWGVDVYNVKNRKYKSITYSYSNYMNLADIEIKNIAKKGIYNTHLSAVILWLLCFVFNIQMMYVYAFLFSIAIIFAMSSKKHNDYHTAKKPQEFRALMQKCSEDDPLRYENLLDEYLKSFKTNHP